jgi:hypothetical protein
VSDLEIRCRLIHGPGPASGKERVNLRYGVAAPPKPSLTAGASTYHIFT